MKHLGDTVSWVVSSPIPKRAGQSLSSKLVLGWVGPAGQGIFHNGTYVHACLFLYFSWTALHVSAQETRSSCVVSFLIHTVDTGFLAELRSDSDPRCFALSTVGFSVMKSIMGDDGVPLVDYSDYRQILWDWKPSAILNLAAILDFGTETEMVPNPDVLSI